MTADEKARYARSFAVHVGVDTGKMFHVLVARGPDGERSKPFRADVSREGFTKAIGHLAGLFPRVSAAHTLVGLEFAGHHGFTFARFLANAGYEVVSVLPAHTKHTKEIEDNSPLKTDEKDAAVICRLLGQGTFVRFPFLQPPYTQLRLLTAHRHRLTVEVTRHKNRLRGLLDVAWPELLERFTSLDKATPLAILDRWPLPEDFVAAGLRRVRHEIKTVSRNHVDADRVRELMQATKATIGLPDAPDERRTEIEFLLSRWRLTREQIAELDKRIAALVEICPEAKALTTVPEVSAVCAATIVSELGTPSDYEHYRQVLKLAGMNLVSKSSGLRGPSVTPKWQSKRGRPMLRRQLFLLAGRWCQARGLYHEDYQAMRARNGGLRTQAVCSLARKLVPMLLAVMKTQRPFDLDLWLANRRQREAA